MSDGTAPVLYARDALSLATEKCADFLGMDGLLFLNGAGAMCLNDTHKKWGPLLHVRREEPHRGVRLRASSDLLFVLKQSLCSASSGVCV